MNMNSRDFRVFLPNQAPGPDTKILRRIAFEWNARDADGSLFILCGRYNLYCVEYLNGIEYGLQVMVSILTFCSDAQSEIDLAIWKLDQVGKLRFMIEGISQQVS